MIEKMTQEQGFYMIEYRNDWIKCGENTELVSFSEAQKLIHELYEAYGYDKPIVFLCDSPLMCQLYINLFKKNLEANLKANLEGNLRANLWANLKANLEGNLRANLEGNLRANLWANLEGNLRANLWANLEGDLWANLKANLKANLEGNLRANLEDKSLKYEYMSLGGNFYSYWLAFYDFPRYLGHNYPEDLNKRLDATINYSRKLSFLYAYKGIAFVSQKPIELHRNDKGRLHNSSGPSMLFKDGYSLWYYHGVKMPKEIILDHKLITPHRIKSESNAEVRRAMIELYGREKYVTSLKLKHQDKTGKLMTDNNGYDVVEVVNGSKELDGTYKKYYLAVPPTCKTAMEAVAWTYQMTVDQYKQLQVRT